MQKAGCTRILRLACGHVPFAAQFLKARACCSMQSYSTCTPMLPMMSPASLPERLRACYSGAIHDVLRAKGHSKQTLPHHIRPLNLSHKLAGPVFTIEGRRDDSLDPHQSLLKWCELLSRAPSNVV